MVGKFFRALLFDFRKKRAIRKAQADADLYGRKFLVLVFNKKPVVVSKQGVKALIRRHRFSKGFTPEKAESQFGFLMNAFKYGAPPHGGLAYGLDRWVSLFAGLDSIRDCIAFPKNNAGRDVMIDAPDVLDQAQLDELQLQLNLKK